MSGGKEGEVKAYSISERREPISTFNRQNSFLPMSTHTRTYVRKNFFCCVAYRDLTNCTNSMRFYFSRGVAYVMSVIIAATPCMYRAVLYCELKVKGSGIPVIFVSPTTIVIDPKLFLLLLQVCQSVI